MAWYLAKNDGNATADNGRYTSEQTGSFASIGASGYYDSIQSAMGATTAPAAGDFILCSHLHNHSTISAITYTGINNSTPLNIISVDDTAANVRKKGAKETCTSSGNDINWSTNNSSWFIYGMEFVTNDDINFAVGGGKFLLRNCVLSAGGTSDRLILATTAIEGLALRFEGCEFNFGHTNANLGSIGSAIIEMVGCFTSGSAITNLFNDFGLNNGCQVYAWGCDFNSMSSTANIVSNGGGANGDDNNIFKAYNCRIPSSATIVEETLTLQHPYTEIEFIGVDDTDASRYHYQKPHGTVVSDTTTYRTSSAAVEGAANAFSYKIDTASGVSIYDPFRWELPAAIYKDVSETASDQLTLHITTDGSLDSADIALYGGASDSTTNTLMNFTSTAPKVELHDFLMDDSNAGSALTTTSGEWTSGKTNTYSLTITFSNADADSPLLPYYWLEVYVSTGANSIYVDNEVLYS